MKNKDVTDPKQIQQLIDGGNYVVKELEALYMLRKYRTLKKRYYSWLLLIYVEFCINDCIYCRINLYYIDTEFFE